MEISIEQYNKMAERLAELEYMVAETHWVPCSERLPEEYGKYYITYTSSDYGKEKFVDISEYEVTMEYDYENNRFNGEWLLSDFINKDRISVVAWMPLPKPWEGGEA